jgi:polysaccharide export outer membrane protein
MNFRSFAAIALIAAVGPFSAVTFSQQQRPSSAMVFGQSEYRLGPDDVIQVFVYREPDLSPTVPVRPDGNISLPLIGELQAIGKTPLQLQQEIVEKLRSFFKESDPIVTVMVAEVNSAKVSILGEVKNPGMYKIQDRATLLDAVALAGGFTEYAKQDKVTVIRNNAQGNQQRFKLNVEELIDDPRSELFYVLPYDKIVVQ